MRALRPPRCRRAEPQSAGRAVTFPGPGRLTGPARWTIQGPPAGSLHPGLGLTWMQAKGADGIAASRPGSPPASRAVTRDQLQRLGRHGPGQHARRTASRHHSRRSGKTLPAAWASGANPERRFVPRRAGKLLAVACNRPPAWRYLPPTDPPPQCRRATARTRKAPLLICPGAASRRGLLMGVQLGFIGVQLGGSGNSGPDCGRCGNGRQQRRLSPCFPGEGAW
jgi:hypothetical protein